MTDQDHLHTELLHLGGRVPDALLAEARLRLADTGTVILPEPPGPVDLPFTFASAVPNPRVFGGRVPPLADLTGREGLMDDTDRVAVAAARQQPGAVALWRGWRIAPEWAAAVIPPAPVYVLETDGPQAVTAAAVMRALAAAGISAPLVEVYRPGDKLPPYSAAARRSGALLWADRDTAPPRIARVFDEVDDDGARFAPDHERLSGTDLARAAAYLDAGTPVLATTARGPDVVEPERGPGRPDDLPHRRAVALARVRHLLPPGVRPGAGAGPAGPHPVARRAAAGHRPRRRAPRAGAAVPVVRPRPGGGGGGGGGVTIFVAIAGRPRMMAPRRLVHTPRASGDRSNGLETAPGG